MPEKRYKLSDAYCFPGFKTYQYIEKMKNDSGARIIRLKRIKKNAVPFLWEMAPGLL
jgi:hypothetical protein